MPNIEEEFDSGSSTNYTPEFIEENEYLQVVLDYIDEEVRTRSEQSPATAAYSETADQIQKERLQYIEALRRARPNSHFGRIEFRKEDEPGVVHTYYIGKEYIPDHVFHYASPVAALFFNPYEPGYKSNEGFIEGTVDLTRFIHIKDSNILRPGQLSPVCL